MMNNKDLAPRFKRNLMSPASQPLAEDLQMRPTQNSLLYKASQTMNKQQPLPMQPPHHQQGGYSSQYGGRSGNSENGHYGQQQPPQNLHHQAQQWSNRSNPSPPLQQNEGLQQPYHTNNQMKGVGVKPLVIMDPTSSTPINNILKKDEIIIKPAGGDKAAKKEKKDRGPSKEEYLKKVNAFLNEHLLDDAVNITAIEDTEVSRDEEQDVLNEDVGKTENGKENGISTSASPTPPAEIDVVVVVESDDKQLTMDKVVAAFMELKVPDKFIKDSIIKILTEILDKSDAMHDRIIEFLLALRKENRCSNNVISEAFKHMVNTMGEKEKTVPKVTTVVASLLSRAVTTKLCKLSDIASYTESGQHYPLFLLVLQQLHKKMGRQPLSDLFGASKVNLMTSLPEVDRTKDRMAEILEDRNLSFLYPLLRVQAELWKQIQADSNPQQFYKWIKENIEPSLYTDPGFITAMMTVIVKYITKVSGRSSFYVCLTVCLR